jgi:hypothetical protein
VQQALVAFDAGVPLSELPAIRFHLTRGQVVRMSSRRTGAPVRPLTPAQQEAARVGLQAMHSARGVGVPDQAELTRRGRGDSTIPDVVGGQVPPRGALASGGGGPRKKVNGKVPVQFRRQYGLRALDRGSSILLEAKD